MTIFLTSMSHFPKIVELRRKWFSAPYPADTIVEVAALYSPDAMIEIEAVAIVDPKSATAATPPVAPTRYLLEQPCATEGDMDS